MKKTTRCRCSGLGSQEERREIRNYQEYLEYIKEHRPQYTWGEAREMVEKFERELRYLTGKPQRRRELEELLRIWYRHLANARARDAREGIERDIDFEAPY